MSTLTIVLDELNKIEHKKGARNYVILCPFHNDSRPSMNINVDENNRKASVGWGYCMACGASKSWNDIATKLGLKLIDKSSEAKAAATVRPISGALKDSMLGKSDTLTFDRMLKVFGCFISEEVTPEDNWRGFSGKLLSKVGCHKSADDFGNKCLIMPVLVDSDLVGGIKALWSPTGREGEIKYQNMPGEWSKTHGLFPYDYTAEMIKKRGLNYVVLVEGSRDALRLIKYGIPAIAILGTMSWGRVKKQLVLELPVDNVVIFMDGDSAGVEASNNIRRTLKKSTNVYAVKTYDYTKRLNKVGEKGKLEKVDPGSIKKAWLLELRDEIFSKF